MLRGDQFKRSSKSSQQKFEFVHVDNRIFEFQDKFDFQYIDLPESLNVKAETKDEYFSVGFEILSTYPGSKFRDTCVSELGFVSNPRLGYTQNIYTPGKGSFMVSIGLSESDIGKFDSFWVEDEKKKRSGWLLSSDSETLSEIKDISSDFNNAWDCGPDCDVPPDPFQLYSISGPIRPGLKINLSSNQDLEIWVTTSYSERAEPPQPPRGILVVLKKGQPQTLHLTDLPTK